MPQSVTEDEARQQRLSRWAADSVGIHPLVQRAHENGCLSLGTLETFASREGIPLACTSSPVALILPVAPARDHSPRPSPRRPGHGGGVRFEGGEHTAIGDSVLLRFSATDKGTPAWQVQLALPNGLSFTYGQIVALGGDFYGIPEAPISDGATQAERITRFYNAYNQLASSTEASGQAQPILQVMQTEIDAVNQALAQGQPASSAYAALGDTLSGKWNVITGGGSVITPLYPLGRYLKLAAVNWDHFSQHAVLAYQAGHAAALTQALAARNGPQWEQHAALVVAYAINAFADHFLSDLFSAGHLRTPRKQLYDTSLSSDVGSLLARYMHDEDSHWGLNVTNQAGSAWHSYGDKRYFDTVDLANRALVDAAVQTSVDEIFQAFSTGNVPQSTAYAALARVADLAAVQDRTRAQAAGNVSPLFAWDGSVVLRRKDINGLDDYSWTSSWWVASTYSLLLASYAPGPPQGYMQPPAGSPAISPDGWQSAVSVPPNWVAGARVRYAVAVVGALYESDPGPWGAYVTVAANQAYPTLSVPTGPDGTVLRRIYRQFSGADYTNVGQIADNTTTVFVDNSP